MGLGVANLERHSACVREMRVDEKRETERNERPHVGQDNERRFCESAGRWQSAVKLLGTSQTTPYLITTTHLLATRQTSLGSQRQLGSSTAARTTTDRSLP